MKIRIATTSPRNYTCPGITIWNVRSIDEFVDRFVREDQLVIGNLGLSDSLGIKMPIRNFTAHNKYIATSETERPLEDYIFILGTLSEVDAPDRCAFHNINVVPDDYDPLKNPKAEAARREERAINSIG